MLVAFLETIKTKYSIKMKAISTATYNKKKKKKEYLIRNMPTIIISEVQKNIFTSKQCG